ncbi:MAG TPA: hypothetical protein VFE82_06725 [Ramlibacter sp.]|jgi:hypothetical protein|uniref:hypothetical protein n=1 Tax=Ramlibacter sp. TaxID=1917967 RepID=UPI002D4807CE|nr:hypothetical protein [Ramlibacter sp.]HZY18159.1 hypothetical protein [Ramlibacter sp.]
MGLLNKIFRSSDSGGTDSELSATRFEESTDLEQAERESTRRELVKVVLRETMRRHAVPSDWLDCRILPVITSKRTSGMHVQLVVLQGQGNLLGYIPAFQSSFMAEIEKFEPRAWDWLLSISWQFAGITASTGGSLPAFGQDESRPRAQAAMAASGAVPDEGPVSDLPPVEDDLAKDLQALFAIRDAALNRDGNPHADAGFQPTRPAFVPSRNDPGT